MRKLIIVDDEGRRTNVPLVRSEVTIGRDEGNTIRLTERNVSRRHVRIFRDGDAYRIEDLSRYGTRRNGTRIAGLEPFVDGDVIMIGSYRVELVEVAGDAPDVTGSESPPVVPGPEPMRLPSEEVQAVPDGPPPITGATRRRSQDDGSRARLVCLSEPFIGSEFALTEDEMTIGTANDCDLIIAHRSVAPHHAIFTFDADGYALAPMDAGYPVAVNGRYNPHGPLRAGDEVLLGELKFRFALPGENIGFVPLDDIEDEVRPGGRPAWLLPAIGVAAVVLVVAAVASRGCGEEPLVEVVAEGTASGDSAEASGLARGEAHLAAARWSEALEAFESVPDGSPDFDQAQRGTQLATAEIAHRDKYDEAVRAFDQGDYHGALAALDRIALESYYHARAADDRLEERATEALINAALARSTVSQTEGDLAAARAAVEEIRPLVPDDPELVGRVTDRLEEIEQAEAALAEAEAAQRTAPVAAAPRQGRTEAPGRAEPARTEPARDAEPELSSDERRARSAELRNLGARAGIQQNYAEAIRLLEEARELNPGDPQINLMLFSNYRQTGNTSRAASAVRRYLRQRPDDNRRIEYEQWLAENAPD